VTGFGVEVFSSLDEAESTWRSFEAEGTALPYQTFDWVATWSATVGEAADVTPHVVAVYDTDGSRLLLLPLGLKQGPWRGTNGVLATWLAASLGDQLAPILAGRAPDLTRKDVKSLWREVTASLPGADVVLVHNQPAAVYGLANPLHQLELRHHASCHQTRLQPHWDAYYKAKTKSSRRADSRRQLRRLGEIGEVVFRSVTDPADYEAFVDTMIGQKRRRYEETGRADMFEVDTFGAFYHELTRRHGDMITMSALLVGGEIVATDWGVVRHRTFHGLMTTYEGGDWQRYSPGRLLNEWVLQWCCEHEVDVFDFSVGDEAYKTGWCEAAVPLYRAELPVSLRAQVATTPGRIKRRLAGSELLQSVRSAAGTSS
jgi:CelD/BcsL family acetyltransferase involved in cellulose biosynthesis